MSTPTNYSEMTVWECVVKGLVILIQQALLPFVKKNKTKSVNVKEVNGYRWEHKLLAYSTVVIQCCACSI